MLPRLTTAFLLACSIVIIALAAVVNFAIVLTPYIHAIQQATQ